MTNPPPADDRDRDLAGRPRNARPRDGLGRPLPPGAPGVPTTPDGLALTAAQTVAEAQRLLRDGLPFHAHEVLEAAWKSAGDEERELWKGLAQLAVGLTHTRRGNTVGAPRLLRRAADRIEPYATRPPHGIAVRELTVWARALAARIEGEGAADVPIAATVPTLAVTANNRTGGAGAGPGEVEQLMFEHIASGRQPSIDILQGTIPDG